MDLSITSAVPGANRAKTPDPDAETQSGVHTAKPFSPANGVLKRHHFPHLCSATVPATVAYRDCLKNHAASIGGYAVDGCGEFMPSPTATSDPASLKCAACGCHRNFHRRDTEEATPHLLLEYQPHHRHHPPPPPPLRGRSPDSLSPPPLSSSPYQPGGAPQMLLALTASRTDKSPTMNMTVGTSAGMNGRKRFRTKFSQLQKEKMLQFAERVGWKMQRRDEETVAQFCREIGVERGVLKVWMHNNKNTLGKRDFCHDGRSNYAGMQTPVDVVGDGDGDGDGDEDDDRRHNGVQQNHHGGITAGVAAGVAAGIAPSNGSSSS